MSKQSQATTIYTAAAWEKTRKQVIAEIVKVVGVSPAYASTLYNNARKNAVPAVKTPYESAANQSATTHVKPTTKSSTKVTEFNNSSLDMVRAELDRAIAETLEQFGLSGSTGRISYSGTEFKTQLVVSVGDAEDAARESFNKNAWRVGLKPEHFGKEFTTHSGKTFKVTGITPRRRKFPVSATEIATGKGFKFPASQVK